VSLEVAAVSAKQVTTHDESNNCEIISERDVRSRTETIEKLVG